MRALRLFGAGVTSSDLPSTLGVLELRKHYRDIMKRTLRHNSELRQDVCRENTGFSRSPAAGLCAEGGCGAWIAPAVGAS